MVGGSRVNLVLEVLAGVVGGLVLAAPATVVLLPMLGFGQSSLLASLLVYPIGAAVGIWLMGRRLAVNGRLWHAVIGAYIGIFALGMLFAPTAWQPLIVVRVLFVVLPPILGALAFNRFSRPSDPLNPYDDDEVDLLRYHDEGWEDE